MFIFDQLEVSDLTDHQLYKLRVSSLLRYCPNKEFIIIDKISQGEIAIDTGVLIKITPKIFEAYVKTDKIDFSSEQIGRYIQNLIWLFNCKYYLHEEVKLIAALKAVVFGAIKVGNYEGVVTQFETIRTIVSFDIEELANIFGAIIDSEQNSSKKALFKSLLVQIKSPELLSLICEKALKHSGIIPKAYLLLWATGIPEAYHRALAKSFSESEDKYLIQTCREFLTKISYETFEKLAPEQRVKFLKNSLYLRHSPFNDYIDPQQLQQHLVVLLFKNAQLTGNILSRYKDGHYNPAKE